MYMPQLQKQRKHLQSVPFDVILTFNENFSLLSVIFLSLCRASRYGKTCLFPHTKAEILS